MGKFRETKGSIDSSAKFGVADSLALDTGHGPDSPEVCVSVNGQDCTGDIKSWTAKDFRTLAKACEDAAIAMERKVHGCIDEEGIHIGIDFGGEFDDDKGLPAIDRESLRRTPLVMNDYPGQAYFHATNPNIRRAEENWERAQP